MENRHILFDFVRYPEFGGISTVTSIIIPELQKVGYKISVCSHRLPNKKIEVSNVQIYYTPNPDRLCDKKNYKFYDELLNHTHFDIIIYQDSYASVHKMVCELAKKHGIDLYVFEHNAPRNAIYSRTLHPILSIKGLIRRLLHPYFVMREIRRKKYLYSNCKKYILLSNNYIDEFAKYTHVPLQKLIAINNPISLPDESVDLNSKKNEILFVGRMCPEKGVLQLLKYWIHMPKDVDAVFRIVGDGEEKRKCEQYVLKHNINNVKFEGYQIPSKYYMRAKVFWMESKYEGWPMTLVEAMSYGCIPIVSNTFGALYDIIDDGVNGFIVESGRYEKYIKITNMLLSDDGLYEIVAKAAMKKVKKFSLEDIRKEWESLLEE